MKRIGIIGGSFNPPHEGHLSIATHAFDEIGLDEVWMLVTPKNPHKDQSRYAPLPDRMDMAEQLAKNSPWLKPTDIEKNFSTTNTADTLTLLAAMYPDTQFVWIMGADNLATFHKWDREEHEIDGQIVPDWQYIMHNFPIAVMARPGQTDDALKSIAAQHGAEMLEDKPEELGKKNNGWSFIDNPPLNISSTQILADIDAGVTNVPGLPQPIEKMIRKKGLYGTRKQKNAASVEEQPESEPRPEDLGGLLYFISALQYAKAKGADRKQVVGALKDLDTPPEKTSKVIYDLAASLISGYKIAESARHLLQKMTGVKEEQAAAIADAIFESDHTVEISAAFKDIYDKVKALAAANGTYIPLITGKPLNGPNF